ncbi:response regulator transcription factor [Thalassotalea sp. G2M2-11]|uniref:response regulator transcription factor n=1 Tax=Thalassotalea sp. G2M2-11 TaxID=2787627 RepID=UPI0019D1B193|nr:response regulator transcription factor [Thalassotalea sp. G2M2-11]
MKQDKHLLIIDDDKALTALLSEYLAQEGFQISCCHDGLSGLSLARENNYSLILLDVMMPGLTGFEVLKALGGTHSTPILMLTAKGDEADKVLGLNLGADDYLAKPFQHRELLARINAILRRIEKTQTQQQSCKQLLVNQIEVKPTTREVFCHQQSIELTGTEYQVLTLLMENVGQIVSKQTISEQVLQRKLSPFDRSIDMHVSNIRRKFAVHCSDDKVKTVRGAGYIFLSGE